MATALDKFNTQPWHPKYNGFGKSTHARPDLTDILLEVCKNSKRHSTMIEVVKEGISADLYAELINTFDTHLPTKGQLITETKTTEREQLDLYKYLKVDI